MMRRRVTGTIFLVIAFGLIPLAFSPRVLARIPDVLLFAGLSTLMLVMSSYQLVTASRLADEVSQKMVDASPLRRLGLPARWYSKGVLVWQYRMMSIMGILMALMTALLASIIYRRGL